MLMLSDYRINHFNEKTTRSKSTTNVWSQEIRRSPSWIRESKGKW